MKSEQLTTEDWKDFNRENQAIKAKIRDEITAVVEHFCTDNRILLVKMTPYHFRLTLAGYNRLDIYPTTSSVVELKKGQKRKVVDVYKFLRKYYGKIN
jgi:hypothetical protein